MITDEEIFKNIFQSADVAYSWNGCDIKNSKVTENTYRLGIRKNEYGSWLCNIRLSFNKKEK
jgi:hypothetical protein